MKRIFPVVILAMLATSPVFSQTTSTKAPATASPATAQRESPEDRAQAITAGMVKNLRLNPAQAEKVKQINLTSIKQVEALRQQYKTNPGRLDQEVKTVSSSRLSQLKEVLSPSQFALYDQRRQDKMGIPKEAGAQIPE